MTATNANEKTQQTPNQTTQMWNQVWQTGQPPACQNLNRTAQRQKFLDAKVKQIVMDTLTELNLVPKPENKKATATTTAPNANAKASDN